MTSLICAVVIGVVIGSVSTLLLKAKAITLGNKLMVFAENDYDAALNHVYTFLRLKK